MRSGADKQMSHECQVESNTWRTQRKHDCNNLPDVSIISVAVIWKSLASCDPGLMMIAPIAKWVLLIRQSNNSANATSVKHQEDAHTAGSPCAFASV